MGRVTLVTGGCRSGKSAYAQAQAEAIVGRRLYLATGPALDAEMARRIEAHQKARAGCGWETVEEPMDPGRVLRESAGEYAVCLLDCLTLWVNNRMFEAQRWGDDLDEAGMEQHAQELLEACREFGGAVFLVTNEVGMGIVPENALARRFRDLAGRCNQVVAAGADVVTLVVSGVPLHLKGKDAGL
jgi:adenosylcobinamide kinase/adenosylcobinamide-phosphate guanylyltransferase